MISQTIGATSAPPSTKSAQISRIAEAGVSPSTAIALADLFFPTTKRDDHSLLEAVTAVRVGASAMELR